MIAYRIETATLDDLPGIIALFDDALAWLTQRGITGQWGTTPFSALPTMREHFGALIDRGAMFVARSDHGLIGTVAVGPHVPAYALPVVEGLLGVAYYLEALATARRHKGHAIGQALLRWAESRARQQGASYLRLDCWAGNPALCAYYEREGFAPLARFDVGDWQGQLFEKGLDPR